MASAADGDVCWPPCDLSSVTGSQSPLLQAPTRVRCMYVCVCYRHRPWMALMGDVWQACCRHPSLSDVCNCCGGEAERCGGGGGGGGGEAVAVHTLTTNCVAAADHQSRRHPPAGRHRSPSLSALPAHFQGGSDVIGMCKFWEGPGGGEECVVCGVGWCWC